MTPQRACDPYDWPALLTLVQDAFAGMEGRIDPPSSMHQLTAKSVSEQAKTGEIWMFDDGGPVACVFLTPKPGRLYLGKLATAASHRGRGLASALIETAAARAQALSLPILELETRVELVENHRYFAAHGFAKTGETAHKGYNRPTSITLQRKVDLT